MESKKRAIIKSLTYRALATAILAVISWIYTSNVGQTTIITVIYTVLSTAGYYAHERLWDKTNWEIKKERKTQVCK